jgi:formylmethanofuran dehydrogenase subunit E
MKSFKEVVGFHGHSCPGLALGYRVALAALREMDMVNISEDEELIAIVENDSCAVDAIQVMTGCTFGKGNLLYKAYGKQVYTFIKRPSGKAIRISVDFVSPEETKAEKEMWKRYSRGDRSRVVLRAVHNRKAKKTRAVLDAPETKFMKISEVKVSLPSAAKIFRSIKCGLCGEKVAEPRARVKDGKPVCIPCLMKE